MEIKKGKAKTAKQKCLEMWEWLAANPGQSKFAYHTYLSKQGREQEFEYCWACKAAEGNCALCPITWPSGSCEEGTYIAWENALREESPRAAERAALKIVKLIKETWNE